MCPSFSVISREFVCILPPLTCLKRLLAVAETVLLGNVSGSVSMLRGCLKCF